MKNFSIYGQKMSVDCDFYIEMCLRGHMIEKTQISLGILRHQTMGLDESKSLSLSALHDDTILRKLSRVPNLPTRHPLQEYTFLVKSK